MFLRFVMATGEARWSLVKGLRLQSLMDYRAESKKNRFCQSIHHESFNVTTVATIYTGYTHRPELR
jgi:hypothetical protein